MAKRCPIGKRILGAIGIMWVTWWVSVASGRTLFVDISGLYYPSGYRSIQQGIIAASDGDTVAVMSSGLYQENIHFLGKDIVVTGTGGAVILGSGSGPTVTFAGTESEACTLHSFVITGGLADHGGGICGGDETHHTRARIVNNLIQANQAEKGGGLAYCDGTILANTIAQNHADSDGGGLYSCDGTIQANTIVVNTANAGGGLYDCNGLIRNNTITDNSVIQMGGGLCFCDGTISSNRITGNKVTSNFGGGGGMFSCRGRIFGNHIRENSCHQYGGGLDSCDGVIEGNLIVANWAGASGGGLYWCRNGTIRNNIIALNKADVGGGAASCHPFLNNTITGNSVQGTGKGAGLYYCGGDIQNCIIWGNTAGDEIDPLQVFSSGDPSYSCIQGWSGGGPGNVLGDPNFADPDGPDNDAMTYEDNDYRLSSGSPCIDTGDNSALGTAPGADLDGHLRIANGIHSLTVDMGAYEYNSAFFEILAIRHRSPHATHLHWRSQPGDTYTIWSCSELLNGTWMIEETLPSQGAETLWSDLTIPGPKQFYRIEIP